MTSSAAIDTSDSEAWPTPRQGEVLDAALSLLVSKGDKLTMNAVAREASCSKETLYKWFGDREGLLTAVVQWQAAKVGVPKIDPTALDAGNLKSTLEAFGYGLVSVLASETSIALNRVAIAQAADGKLEMGAIVLANGRHVMGKRLKPVLEAGRAAGLLQFEDSEDAFRDFFGLVVRDVHIRVLLGDTPVPGDKQLRVEAHAAVGKFMLLFGTDTAIGQ